MNWNEYQQQALTTAIYPLERELDYTILGLCSETGELGEAFLTGTPEDLLSEMGDCYWYVAAVADALKLPLHYIAGYSDQEVIPFNDHASNIILEIVAESAKMAGVLKKSIRDNDGYLSDAANDKLNYSLFRTLWLLNALCHVFGTSCFAVMAKNLDKLADRKKRGVIQGSGDNR
jgi:hypothetical protein